MTGRYLTDLADVVRAAGLAVVELDGWTHRARSTGGYASGRPTHVMVHHTASPPSQDGRPDAEYCATGADAAPLANLYLDRAGTVWILAAGATNTNGSGHDWWGGGVPDDSMNTYAVGIEAGNDGTGEPWPDVQQDAYLELVAALCQAYAVPLGHVRAHREWAPDRKIDPAGNSRYATGSASWDMDAFRGDVIPTPPPTPQEDPVTDDDIDRIAWAVWSLMLDGAASASTLLQTAAGANAAALAAPGNTVNFPVPFEGTTADLWSVIVDTATRVRRLETQLTKGEP